MGKLSFGEVGERIIDNDMYSIDLLETTCAGREFTATYILTKKADQDMTVDVWVDTDFVGKVLDGTAENDGSGKVLTLQSYTDRFTRYTLLQNSEYTLARNQELCIVSQLAAEDYVSGTYMLYANCHIRKKETIQGGGKKEISYERWINEDGKNYCSAPIEIAGNSKYGLGLSGAMDRTEGEIHFEEYEVYISPLTIYVNLSGERMGSLDSRFNEGYQYEISLGFWDGTEIRTVIEEEALQRSRSDDKGVVISMRASFDRAIDPESIVSVGLDGAVIMDERGQ